MKREQTRHILLVVEDPRIETQQPLVLAALFFLYSGRSFTKRFLLYQYIYETFRVQNGCGMSHK